MAESEHERGALNLGCEELLLDPDQLSRLLYEDDRDRQRPSRQREVEASDYSEQNNKDERVIQVRSVLPAPSTEDNTNDNDNEIDNDDDNDNHVTTERPEEEIEAKLPPVRLHKVQSEDLTWLDTIIKHNSLDQTMPETGYFVND